MNALEWINQAKDKRERLRLIKIYTQQIMSNLECELRKLRQAGYTDDEISLGIKMLEKRKPLHDIVRAIATLRKSQEKLN